jgi:aerobic carbon-monoxide dehydrogenase medium subunit
LKAPSFAYAKPRSLTEAFDLLERPNAKILAGGQSLIPALNMRLSAPELLVDITGLPGLSSIEVRNGAVRIGALCTHTQVERSREVREHLPLVAEAVGHIAHPAIRNRGTMGGSLALADPNAELPACAVALDARLIVAGKKGERSVPAAKFFKALYETELGSDEILVGAEFPKAAKSAFLELARRHGDYAIVGLAAAANDVEKRLAFFGMAATPLLIRGKSLGEAKAALQGVKPNADIYNSPATKLHLAGVLLERAWPNLS